MSAAKPNNMLEAKVPVVSDADAAKIYSTFDPSQMMAAGGNGKVACSGDSGGPLFATHKALGGAKPSGRAPDQYGIASFQRTMSGKVVCDSLAVYFEVNAPSIREFIVSKMGQ